MTDERIVKWKCPECGNYHKWVWDIYDIFGGEITMVCDNPECGRTSKMYMVVEKGGNATAFVSAFNGNVEEKLRKATEKVMNSQMTETEKIKAEIKVLEKKLSFLEELERTKTPCEEAFKRVYGYFPTEPNWDDDEVRWESFQKGYNASQKDYKVGEYQATPKEPEKWDVVRESVKWCEEHPDESVETLLLVWMNGMKLEMVYETL